MSKLFCFFIALAVSLTAISQDPVILTYSIKKVTVTEYELRISAEIQDGWHLYSQKQPDDAVAIPTAIKLKKNPLLNYTGIPKEEGYLKKVRDEATGIGAWYYSQNVSFVQKIRLKGKAKTNISGTVTYQVCTDERCLVPKTVQFSLKIE